MARFILGYVAFGIATIVYEWNRYFGKNLDETFEDTIKEGGADDLPKTIQNILFFISWTIVMIIYFVFWPKAIYDAICERYQKED